MVHSKNKSGIKHLFHGAIWCFFFILLTIKPFTQHESNEANQFIQKGDTTIVCALPVYKPGINQVQSSQNKSTLTIRINKGKTNK